MSLKNAYLAVALLSGLSLAACSNTAAGVKKDAEINADKAAAAADKAEDKADAAADKAEPAAHEAAAETREAARDASGAVKAAVETVDVK